MTYATRENTLAKEVVLALDSGMLCLADRGFFGYEMHAAVAVVRQCQRPRLIAGLGQHVPAGPGTTDAGRPLLAVPDLVFKPYGQRVHTTVGMRGQRQQLALVGNRRQRIPPGLGAAGLRAGLLGIWWLSRRRPDAKEPL